MNFTSHIFMVSPDSFAFNKQTSVTNAFQNSHVIDGFKQKALQEFKNAVSSLKTAGIEVSVYSSPKDTPCPDAVFPNNWISTHSDGSIVTYPMLAKNRQTERQESIISDLKENFSTSRHVDLAVHEASEKYLEGTGSLILDRSAKVAFVCNSLRSDEIVVNDFCKQMGYSSFPINAVHRGVEVYHTNVLLSLVHGIAVVCLEIIEDSHLLVNKLEELNYKVMDISATQLDEFGANILGLKDQSGKNMVAMSTRARASFTREQIGVIEERCEIVSCAIPTIESIGGGSLRCMIAEIFLKK